MDIVRVAMVACCVVVVVVVVEGGIPLCDLERIIRAHRASRFILNIFRGFIYSRLYKRK